MRWSFSGHGSFRKCPRQWFYKQVFSSPLAKDPIRREAHRLSKLESVQAWRGKIVDSVISETIIPSIAWGRPCSLEAAKKRADEQFAAQRSERMTSSQEITFLEAEYGMPLTDEMFRLAETEIHAALDSFYGADAVWSLLRKSKGLIPQRPLSFTHGSAAVRVVPDLIAFQANQPPVVLDWKVNRYPMRDYWLQLVTGAIGISRCNPHRDWPNGSVRHEPQNIQLLEIQLLAGDVRAHIATEADVQDAEDFISVSATDMELACGEGNQKTLAPQDFPVTSDPRVCHWCPFKKLCWGSAT